MEISLYRKYRPDSFDRLFGQESIKKSIANALDNNKLAHAYLFNGPRGVGKTTVARIIAKGLNCEKNGVSSKPCLECESCIQISNSSSTDVIEIDAASNRGIDEIRALKENVSYNAMKLRYKVYIIDEVHMLTNEAFNALLKTLEEPPKNVVFILATTEINKLPETIISRCVTYIFNILNENDIIEMLEYCAKNENINIDRKSLERIYKKSSGSARDSLSILEQIASTYLGEEITLEKTDKALGIVNIELLKEFDNILKSKNSNELINFIDNLYLNSVDILNFLKDFCSYLKENESDIKYTINVISTIYQSLNEFKYEDDIKIISYIICHKLFTTKTTQSKVEINFDYQEFLNELKNKDQNLYLKILSEFEFVKMKDMCIILKQKYNKEISKAIIENETTKRFLEEIIYEKFSNRYIIKLDNNKLQKQNKEDKDFIKSVKNFFEVERIIK